MSSEPKFIVEIKMPLERGKYLSRYVDATPIAGKVEWEITPSPWEALQYPSREEAERVAGLVRLVTHIPVTVLQAPVACAIDDDHFFVVTRKGGTDDVCQYLGVNDDSQFVILLENARRFGNRAEAIAVYKALYTAEVSSGRLRTATGSEAVDFSGNSKRLEFAVVEVSYDPVLTTVLMQA